MIVRHDAQHRNPAQLLEHLPALFEEPQVAPELIDQNPFHTVPLLGAQQHHRAIDAREDAAAVDVAHQDDVGAGVHRHRDIHQVGVAQVDLGQAACTLHYHRIVAGSQPVEGGVHGLAQLGPAFLAEVVVGVAVADGPAVEHHLGSVVALGLEQQRIHIGVAGDAGGFGLDGLRPPDLQPVLRSEGVQCHILGLERSRVVSVLAEDPAERRGDDALAHVAASSGEHHGMEAFFHSWFL